MPTTSTAASLLVVAALTLYSLAFGLLPMIGFIACAVGISGLHQLFFSHCAAATAGA